MKKGKGSRLGGGGGFGGMDDEVGFETSGKLELTKELRQATAKVYEGKAGVVTFFK